MMIVTFLSLFIGGFISGGKGKKQGIVLGGGTGILYLVIILLFQYLGHDSLFSCKSMDLLYMLFHHGYNGRHTWCKYERRGIRT